MNRDHFLSQGWVVNFGGASLRLCPIRNYTWQAQLPQGQDDDLDVVIILTLIFADKISPMRIQDQTANFLIIAVIIRFVPRKRKRRPCSTNNQSHWQTKQTKWHENFSSTQANHFSDIDFKEMSELLRHCR